MSQPFLSNAHYEIRDRFSKGKFLVYNTSRWNRTTSWKDKGALNLYIFLRTNFVTILYNKSQLLSLILDCAVSFWGIVIFEITSKNYFSRNSHIWNYILKRRQKKILIPPYLPVVWKIPHIHLLVNCRKVWSVTNVRLQYYRTHCSCGNNKFPSLRLTFLIYEVDIRIFIHVMSLICGI